MIIYLVEIEDAIERRIACETLADAKRVRRRRGKPGLDGTIWRINVGTSRADLCSLFNREATSGGEFHEDDRNVVVGPLPGPASDRLDTLDQNDDRYTSDSEAETDGAAFNAGYFEAEEP